MVAGEKPILGNLLRRLEARVYFHLLYFFLFVFLTLTDCLLSLCTLLVFIVRDACSEGLFRNPRGTFHAGDDVEWRELSLKSKGYRSQVRNPFR